MLYFANLDKLPIRDRSQKPVRAFTLIELVLVMVIVGTLGAIAVPAYNGYIDRGRNATAMADIVDMGQRLATFQAERGASPNTLAQAGINLVDPWGRPYQYLRLDVPGQNPKNIPGHRKDKSMNPINTDFDLYSLGKDGRSQDQLVTQDSHDDIIRANNGAFIGLASEF